MSQVFLRVNGNATAVRSYRCETVGLGRNSVAARLRPCPRARTETLSANASAAPFKPGINAVQVCARDYADPARRGFGSNTTCTAPRRVNAHGGCDKIAAPNGSDRNSGSPGSPYRSAQRLVNSLSSGHTGCLRAGTFSLNNTIEVTRPGITLTSFPGERGTLKGELKIEKGANQVTVRELNLDGRSPWNLGPMVFAANTTFDRVDVTNYNTGICFILGAADPAYGRAVNTVIENSRIHNCGVLPPRNGDHGIYAQHATGAIIKDNWIYDNADRGIQLYPDSQGARIYRNVIDGNGEGIIVSDASSNNLIYNNVISNSNVRWNVETSNLYGTGNVVRDNCLRASNSDGYYNSGGGVAGSTRGLSVGANVIADPLFVNRFWKDFRLQPTSPCAFIYG